MVAEALEISIKTYVSFNVEKYQKFTVTASLTIFPKCMHFVLFILIGVSCC